MKLQKLNKYLKVQIIPELENARPGWDKPHTLAVVHYINKILDNNLELDLDRYVLMISAYAHDWGYAGLFEGGYKLQLDEVYDKKATHMQIGAEKVKELLEDDFFDFLDQEQKDRVVYLVKHHDSYENIQEDDWDLRVLVEADTLGALDYDLVKPTFNKESLIRVMKEFRNDRVPVFLTDYSKKRFESLAKKAEKYYDVL